jgi:hypothetical protein
MRLTTWLGAACGIFVLQTPLQAQNVHTVEEITAEKDRLIAEKDRITAEKDRLNAQAELERARITSLGLPSYDNKTTLTDGAGKTEALILAANTLGGAASLIKDKLTDGTLSGKTYLVLAGDEVFDFARYETLRAEVDAVRLLFDDALGRPQSLVGATGDVATAMATFKGITGLFAAETTVTGIDLTSALPSRLLALGVASKLGAKARIPSAVIRTAVSTGAEPAEWSQKSIAQAYAALVADAQSAKAARAELPEKPTTDNDKLEAAKLDAALARWKIFNDRASAPDEKGAIPLIVAGRLDALAKRNDLVLRLRVEQAGGSLINTKNLATTLGVDPVKVSGGSIVSYIATDAGTGEVVAGGVISCRSTLTALRHVQTGKWKDAARDAKDRCDALI